MLGKAVQSARLGVLVMEGIAVIAAIAGIAYMTTSSGNMMDNLSAKWSEDMRLDDGIVATGGDVKQMKADHAALLAMAALPGEAARNSDSLQVGLVSFRNVQPADGSGYTPVTLSVGKLSQAATLLIPDGPTHWTIKNSNIYQRAKLAFEGKSPVRASGLHQGLLAGTRLKSFDANVVSGPDSMEEERGVFCDTMRAWSTFFGVTLEKTYVSKILVDAETKQVSAGDRGFRSRRARIVKRGTAAAIC